MLRERVHSGVPVAKAGVDDAARRELALARAVWGAREPLPVEPTLDVRVLTFDWAEPRRHARIALASAKHVQDFAADVDAPALPEAQPIAIDVARLVELRHLEDEGCTGSKVLAVLHSSHINHPFFDFFFRFSFSIFLSRSLTQCLSISLRFENATKKQRKQLENNF